MHRFLPPSLCPLRPLNSNLTSTLEVITSKEFVKESCVHRSDVREWHDTVNEYGQCVICISLMSENRTTLDMVVRDWSRGGDIPSQFYKLPLPIMQGVNHITWCSNMNLKVGCASTLEGLIESDQHYMHARLWARHLLPIIDTTCFAKILEWCIPSRFRLALSPYLSQVSLPLRTPPTF